MAFPNASRVAVDPAHPAPQTSLDGPRCGAVLVDGRGRVCAANALALVLLERGEGLALAGGCLRAEDPSDAAALRHLLRSASGGGAGGMLLVSRGARGRPLLVSASSLCPRGGGVRSHSLPSVLVLLDDHEHLPALHEPALQSLYGLTPAEARVASRLAQGETVEEIAGSLGVRRTTVRTQLHQALVKTGTHRQAELVRLVLCGAGPSPRSPFPAPSAIAIRETVA